MNTLRLSFNPVRFLDLNRLNREKRNFMKYLPIYLPIYLPGLNISKSTLGDLAQPLFATRSQVSQGSELEWFLSEVAGEVTHQVPWPSDAMGDMGWPWDEVEKVLEIRGDRDVFVAT